MTEYRKDFVADFAKRTFENLAEICRGNNVAEGKGFEVTQLINSFVGLLIFPQQEQNKNHWEGRDQRPNFNSSDYWNVPFPNVKIELAYHEVAKDEYIQTGSDFQKMIQHLRNAVSHQNLQVEPLESDTRDVTTGEVTGFRFTDTNPKNSSQSITLSLSIDDIYNILMSTLYRIMSDNFDYVKAAEIAKRFKDCTLNIDRVLSTMDQQCFHARMVAEEKRNRANQG